MDPDVTHATAIDENADPDERHAAAVNLLIWMYGGGFLPSIFMELDRQDLIEQMITIRDQCRPDRPIR